MKDERLTSDLIKELAGSLSQNVLLLPTGLLNSFFSLLFYNSIFFCIRDKKTKGQSFSS